MELIKNLPFFSNLNKRLHCEEFWITFVLNLIGRLQESRYPIIPIQFGIKANMNWIGHLERVQVCFVNLILVALHFSQLRWDVPLLISKSFTNEVTHHVKSPSTNYRNQVPKGVNECVPRYHHTSSPFFPHAFQHTVSFWCITVTVTQCCTRILNKPSTNYLVYYEKSIWV